MWRRYPVSLALVLILSLLVQPFPAAPVRAQESTTLEQATAESLPDPEPPPDTPLLVEPWTDPHLPSLVVQLAVEPQDWVRVGDLITATITVWNQADDPAHELSLTLPVSDDVTPLVIAGATRTGDSWRWEQPVLDAGATFSTTVVMQLAQVPPGEALLLEPQAIARGLPVPASATGGALVSTEAPEAAPVPQYTTFDPAFAATPPAVETPALTDTPNPAAPSATADTPTATAPSATPTPTRGPHNDERTTRYTPGQATVLQSGDGRVRVEIPAGAYDKPLDLVHRSRARQRQALHARGEPEPPAVAGFRRGFGWFALEATDDQGRSIHQFKAPLTLSVRFTPQQLKVLGILATDLSIFWFDESKPRGRPDPQVASGTWVALHSVVDETTGVVQTQVDHFSGFQLSDGSSPSAAYLPSLKGWQVDTFTGAFSYRYDFDIPAGPGAIKPDLALNYNSATTDGLTGLRENHQASWVGKGWSLDLGSIALRKLVDGDTYYNTYVLTLGGRTYDLVKAQQPVPGLALTPVPGNPSYPVADPNNLTHWAWYTTDDSHLKVRMLRNGLSTPGPNPDSVGASDYNQPQQRHKWIVWDKSGIMYEFADDLWWGWRDCFGDSNEAEFESNRWLLSRVVDTHGNVVTYTYDKQKYYASGTWDPVARQPDTCAGQKGTIDYAVYPKTITWGQNVNDTASRDRYKIEFVKTERQGDTDFENPTKFIRAVRETHKLDVLRVFSNQTTNPYDGNTGWLLMREYRFFYDYSLVADVIGSTKAKLTLTGIQQFSNEALIVTLALALPKMALTYHTAPNHDGGYLAAGWNRLKRIDNGQGGAVEMTYAHIAKVIADANPGSNPNIDPYVFENRHRVVKQEVFEAAYSAALNPPDPSKPLYAWTYTYGTPQVNALGKNLEPNHDPYQSNYFNYGKKVTNYWPNSAKLYFNKYFDPYHSGYKWGGLVDRPFAEFRGHDTVEILNPSGYVTKHWFYQGDIGCTPDPEEAQGTPPAMLSDPNNCFLPLRDREFLKGREYQTEVYTTGQLLSRTLYSYRVGPVDMGPLPLSGLWRAFSYLSETQEQTWNAGTTPSTKTTRYYYNADCNWGSPIDAYGNLGCTVELDRGTEVRATKRWYINRNTEVWTRNETTKVDSVAVTYLVDRAWGEAIYNGTAIGATLVGLTHWLYDATTAFQAIGTRGEISLERRYVNLPTSGPCCAGLLLKGQDTQYTYDTYGNRLAVDTFDQPGTTQDNVPSSPGNGSLNRRTWTNYDPIFHVFPTFMGNPQGHSQEAIHDYRMGTLIGVDGPNPNAASMPTAFTCANAFSTYSSTVIADDRTCALYDKLGRLSKLIKPGDTGAAPTQMAVYRDATTGGAPFSVELYEREVLGGSMRYTTKFYDGLGRLIETKLESRKGSQYSSIVTYTKYNADGQPSSQSQPFELIESSSSGVFTFTPANTAALSGMRWTTTTYDGLGRVLTTTTPAPNSQTTTHIYWVLGSNKLQIHDVIDPLRHRIQYSTDSFGRLAAVAEIAGNCSKPSHNYWPQYQCPTESDPNDWRAIGTTSYAYTTLDQLDTVTDMAGNVTNADYDSLGRKIKLIDPDMGTWYYDYDVNGSLRSQIGADLGTLHFTYDWIGRPTSRIGQDGSNTSFADTFNAKDTTNWSWNSYQTVPFSDSGVNVAKNTGTGSNYNASFQRNGYSLSHGEGLTLRFKVSSTSPKALWMVESDGSPYQRVQLLADNGKLRIQYTYDGVYYALTDDSMDLLANAWYRLSMTVDKLGWWGCMSSRRATPPSACAGR